MKPIFKNRFPEISSLQIYSLGTSINNKRKYSSRLMAPLAVRVGICRRTVTFNYLLMIIAVQSSLKVSTQIQMVFPLHNCPRYRDAERQKRKENMMCGRIFVEPETAAGFFADCPIDIRVITVGTQRTDWVGGLGIAATVVVPR